MPQTLSLDVVVVDHSLVLLSSDPLITCGVVEAGRSWDNSTYLEHSGKTAAWNQDVQSMIHAHVPSFNG
eukprot:3091612-Amphidinium_carterae.2